MNLEQRVYKKLLDVPKGQITTYGELAKAVGLKNGQGGVFLKLDYQWVDWVFPMLSVGANLHNHQSNENMHPLEYKDNKYQKEIPPIL